MDHGAVNKNGRKLLETRVCIVNGRVGEDLDIGHFSCGCSVVHYTIASKGLFSILVNFKVHEPRSLYVVGIITL